MFQSSVKAGSVNPHGLILDGKFSIGGLSASSWTAFSSLAASSWMGLGNPGEEFACLRVMDMCLTGSHPCRSASFLSAIAANPLLSILTRMPKQENIHQLKNIKERFKSLILLCLSFHVDMTFRTLSRSLDFGL